MIMFNNKKPFGKEKLSRSQLDGIIDKTEAKLGIEGTGAGVRGGVYSTVASIAVMFAIIIAGAIVVKGALGGGNIESTSEPGAAVTPAENSNDSVYTGALPIPEKVTGIPEEELPESLRYYYGRTAVSYIAKNYSRFAFEPVSSENEHFRITIESLLCDDVTVNVTARLEPLDDVGSVYCNENHVIPVTVAYDDVGDYLSWTEGEYGSNGNVPELDTCKYFRFSIDKYTIKGTKTLQVKMFDPITMYFTGKEPGEPVNDPTDIFAGIEFSLDTASNLETLTLVAESGDNIYISPLQFYRRLGKTHMVITVTDVENDRDGTYTKPDAMSFTINYEDGSSEDFECKSFGYYSYDVSKISSIVYNEQIYYPLH